MKVRRLLRLALFAFAVFFLIMIATILGLGHLSAVRLGELQAPFVRAIRSGPFAPLLLSRGALTKALGIFLNNLRFLAIALAGAALFRWSTPLGRFLGWCALVYFILEFVANAVIGGVVVVSSARITHAAWPMVLLLGVLPHGVFEIFSYALGFALLMAARTRRGIVGPPAVWALLPVGILAFAALIEALVTPHLIHLLK